MLYVIDSAGFSVKRDAADRVISFEFRGTGAGPQRSQGARVFSGGFLWTIDFKGLTFLYFCGSD